MKSIFTFLFFLISFHSISQTKSIICGKVKSHDKFFINFYEPIHGYYNLAFFDTSKQNSALVNGIDSVYKTIQLSNPSFIQIYFTNENNQFITVSHILLFPGDSLHINFDLTVDSPNSIQYKGSNAMGQKLFNEINYQPYDKYIPVFDALDRLPFNKKTFVKEIDSIVLSVISRFDTLERKSLITNKYVEYMKVCFKALFYDEVMKKFLRPNKKRDVINKGERDSIIESFFAEQNPNDLRLKGLYLSPFYINEYYNYLAYKKYNLNSIKPLREGDKVYFIKGNQFIIKEDFVPFIYISDEKAKEDLWALEIIVFFEGAPGKYDKSIIMQYDSIFPNNKWKTLLTKVFKSKYIDKNIGYNLQSPVKFIDTLKKINTINSLLSELPKGKAVFVDIWASWCGPCIAAFGYNKQLDSFLIKKDIEKLYISIDDEESTKKWKQAINKYSLGGYHILTSNALKSDIKINIYHSKGNEGMPIPRYILTDKNGKIVIEDAASPQDFQLLTEQISNALHKNN